MNKFIKTFLAILISGLYTMCSAAELVKDELAESLKTRHLEKPQVNTKYN